MTKYTRLYTGPDGESHFEEVEVSMTHPDMGGQVSDQMRAEGVLFMERDSKGPWHVAPRRQFLIITEGKLIMEIGSGEKREFRPGDYLLAEDTSGRGHFSDCIRMKSIVVPLA